MKPSILCGIGKGVGLAMIRNTDRKLKAKAKQPAKNAMTRPSRPAPTCRFTPLAATIEEADEEVMDQSPIVGNSLRRAVSRSAHRKLCI